MAPALVVAAISAVASLFGGMNAAKAEARAAAEKNRAIAKYNEQVIRQAATETSQVNMQRAQSIRATSVALFNIKQQKVAAQDESANYAAANDNIGASTRAAAHAIATQADRAESEAMIQLDYDNEGYNMMLRNISEGAKNNLQEAYKSQYNALMKKAVVGSVVAGVKSYASAGGTFGMGGEKDVVDTVLKGAKEDMGFKPMKPVFGARDV